MTALAIHRKSFFRSSFFQILVIGIISFLGPGLWNANNSLGAGGALEPYLVKIVFALMGLLCISSAILANSIGVKHTLILGTLGWAPYSASLYQNNRYGTEWFVIFAAVICGISAGLYWAAEGAIVLAYPEHQKRGRYLAIWLAFKNSGQIVGGAINLGLNIHRSTGGKISYTTLLTFVILQAVAPAASFLISNPERVQREDGTRVNVEAKTSTWKQVRILWQTVSTPKLGLLLPLFFSDWFYWGYSSTFLTLYFSVRARALGSFLSAITGVIATTILGIFLDSQRWSLRHRAQTAGYFVMSVFTGILVWAMIIQYEYTHKNPGKLDWTSPGFGRGFGLYIMLGTAGNLVQNYLYWIVGSLGDGTQELTRHAGLLRGVESWGQCASFGINSSKFNPFYVVIINLVFWIISLPAAWFTLHQVGTVDLTKRAPSYNESSRTSKNDISSVIEK
ncbi:MFS general substrate transporter [Macrolepiota fuliginosa MF-IS2]|uniref:MFS general substrate transporter n=1 Tax=Macrolepiota fuliginosa MF-IS2 TaxID=1400762 RepID=A0A9P6C9W9_9AGAR|nr:MFS general substrate transporter [Macrolepiota fuliginosa MF-IS2]